MLRDIVKSGFGRLFPARMNFEQARKVAAALWRDESAFSNPDDVFDDLVRHELISFDLFDTVVRRSVPLEVVHRRTAEFGESFFRGDTGPLPSGLLYGARHKLQEVVKRRTLKPGIRNEVRLADVFDAALLPHVSDPARRKRMVASLIAFEVETEIAVLEVDPRMRSVIERLRAAGRKVILMSDMYLEAPEMERILTALDIRRLFDAVFVSATVGVTKASGLLFEKVGAKVGVPPDRCVHLGDNGHSDVTQARSRGWHARHFVDADLEAARIRRELDLMTGAVAEVNAYRATMEDFCGDPRPGLRHLTAAAFSVFSREVLREAVRGGFDRVLYLTRDGTRFRWIAEDWIAGTAGLQKSNLPKLQDFAFSRRAGILLNYPDRKEPNWQGYLAWTVGWLNNTPLSIRTIMRTFAVAPSELKGLSAKQVAEVEDYLDGDDPATDLGFDRLLERPDLLDPLHAALVGKRERIIAYLDQLGLFDRPEKLLLVDLGYSGTAAKALSEYIWRREAAGRPVASRMSMMLLAANRFHRNNIKEMHPRIELRQGSLIRTDRWQDRAAAANFSWLEPFAVDRSRGSLKDYRSGRAGLEPIFGPGEAEMAGSDSAVAQSLTRREEEMKAAIAAYHAALRTSMLSVEEVDRRVVRAWIKQVIHPDASAVAEVEALHHHAGLGDVRLVSSIDRIDPRRLVPDIQRCLNSDRWIQGSLTRSRLRLITLFVNPILASELK